LLSRSFSEAKPTDFMLELTEEEMKNLTSQFVTSSWGGTRHQSFAFTEQGVAMLSSVLKSKKAIQINISIMRAFVMMRQWALTHQELSKRLDALEQQYGQKFSDIEQVLNFLIQKDQKTIQQGARKEIGFKK
jgi:ORF6N domain